MSVTTSDRTPICPHDIPENETGAARIVYDNLRALKDHENQFSSALSLFDYLLSLEDDQRKQICEDRSQSMSWPHIPARDGGMTIFHFAMALEGARQMRGCRSLRGRIDAAEIRIAVKLFNRRFPDFRHIRHSIAHSAELASTIESLNRNASTSPINSKLLSSAGGVRVVIKNGIQDRTIFNTFLGRHVTYDLSESSLAHLKDARQRVYKSFPGV